MYRQGVLLNTVLLTSLATVIMGMLLRFAPTWQPGYMLAALALVALEAGIVHLVYRRNRMWAGELLRYLAPELLLMAVLMRLAVSATTSEPLMQLARRWLSDPLTAADVPFFLAFAAGLLVGGLTHATMQALRELLPQEFESGLPRNDSAGILHLLARDRTEALRGINTRFIVGGIVVLLSLGIESVNISRITEPGRPISALSATGALLYLVSGFLLYSQARLALLNTRWRLDGATVSPQVARRWARSSWLIIIGVALIAVVLPRTYGLGLLDTLRTALGIIGYGFALLGYGVIWLFSLIALIPAMLLAALAGNIGQNQTVPQPLKPLPTPPQLPPTVAGEPNLAASLIFWACVALLIGYATLTIIRRHPALAEKVLLRGPLRRLWAWLQGFWHDTSEWVALASAKVQERLQRPAAARLRRGSRIRLGALAPRELVRYFYRSTLRRAAEGGLARKNGQTPAEYSAMLRQSLPEADADIAALTEAFVIANYSQREIDRAEAQKARSPWQRLRARLRRTAG